MLDNDSEYWPNNISDNFLKTVLSHVVKNYLIRILIDIIIISPPFSHSTVFIV